MYGMYNQGQVPKGDTFPFQKARWECSVFHCYNYLSALFDLSIGLEEVIAHVEAPTKFTQRVLNTSLPLLNAEIPLVSEAVLIQY